MIVHACQVRHEGRTKDGPAGVQGQRCLLSNFQLSSIAATCIGNNYEFNCCTSTAKHVQSGVHPCTLQPALPHW